MLQITRQVADLAQLQGESARHAKADAWMAKRILLLDPFQRETDRGIAQPCWEYPQPERDAQVNWFNVAQAFCLSPFYRRNAAQLPAETESDETDENDEQIPSYLDPVYDRQRFGLMALVTDIETCACRAVKPILENCPNCGRA